MLMTTRFDLERIARSHARAIYLGKETILANVLSDIKMFLPATDVGIMPHLALDGFWESWITIATARLVKPGMRIVNVGANVGYYALLFAQKVGPEGSVLAIEPNPELCAFLEKSKSLNGFYNLSICNKAASDEIMENVDFVVPKGHAMNARFLHEKDMPFCSELLRVATSTVDRMVSEVWGESFPDLVFIDAEGAEERIWTGMNCVQSKPDVTFIVEYSPKRYKNAVRFAERFVEDGFRISFIKEDGSIANSTPEEVAAGPEVMVVLRRDAK